MAKIIDNINFNAKMVESISKQQNLILKSLTPAITQYNEILSKISTPITEIVQSTAFDSFQQLIDKLNEVHRMYQPIIDSAFIHIDEFIPKFDSVLLNLSNTIEQINFEECSDEEKENLQTATTQLNELEQTIHTPNKKFTREDLYALIQIIIAIFALFQAHYYHDIDSQNDAIAQRENEKFQSAVIELLQEIADNSNEPVEVHLQTTENIQVQVDETP